MIVDQTFHTNQKSIAVFFTHGVSLEVWERQGLFSREIRFYQSLAEQLGEVWLFTYGNNDARFEKRVGDSIRIFPKCVPVPNLIYSFLFPFLYWRQIRKVRLIRIHQMAGAIPALIAHWFLHKPLLVRCGYQWSKFLKKDHAGKCKRFVVSLIEYIAFHAANVIIVSTETDCLYVMKRYRISQKKISVVSNYVDTELFKPFEQQKEKGSVCFVGRLESQKNLFNLIQAAAGTDAHLIFYGEGSLEQALKQKAKTLGIPLTLHGFLSNDRLPNALNACELFILPSTHEGNPKALLEAMACALPVIGTRVEGIESLIDNDENGILCETHPESIRDAINHLMNDPEKQQRLGRAAREKILESASLSHAIETEIHLIQKLHV